MKNIFSKILFPLLVGVIGAFFGNLISIDLKMKSNNKIVKFDQMLTNTYQDIDSNVLGEMKKKKFQILYNGKDIRGFSNIDIKLYNYTGLIKTDIPIYIEVRPQKNDSLQLISAKIIGTDEYVKPVKDSNGSLKFAYILKVANPTANYDENILDMGLAIVSSKKPDIFVRIQKEGISPLPEYRTYENFLNLTTSALESDNAIIIYVLLCGVAALLVIIKTISVIMNPIEEKKKNKSDEEVISEMKMRNKRGEITLTDFEEIIRIYNDITYLNQYNKTNLFNRWLGNMKKPE